MSDCVSMTFHIQENGTVRTQALSKPIIKVGKAPSSDLRIESESISKMHAVIEVEPSGNIQVIDLGSAHGTHVNGKLISKRPLRTGDELQFGDVRVSVEFGEPYNEQQMQLKLQKAFDDAEVLLQKKYPGMEATISLGGIEPPRLGIGPRGLYFQPSFSDEELPLAKSGVPLASTLRCAEALPVLVDVLEEKARKEAEARLRVDAAAVKARAALGQVIEVVAALKA